MTEIRKRIMRMMAAKPDPEYVFHPEYTYWDTGILPRIFQRIELDIEFINRNGVYHLASTDGGNSSYMGIRRGTATGYEYHAMWYAQTATSASSHSNRTLYVHNVLYINDVRYIIVAKGFLRDGGTGLHFSVNGTSNDVFYPSSSYDWTNGYPLYLGAINNKGIAARSTAMRDANIYGCRIYDEDDTTLLLNLVPKWNANGEAQLYDTVEDRWVEWTEAV